MLFIFLLENNKFVSPANISGLIQEEALCKLLT